MGKERNQNIGRRRGLDWGYKYHAAVVFAVVLLLFPPGFFALLCQGESKQGASAWTFNFASAPLRITVTGDRSYSLANESEGKITKYRLGCVQVDEKTHPSIVYRAEIEVEEIGPHALWGVQAFHHLAVRAACEERTSRVAVTEVYFEDGGEWRVPVEVP